jgi:Tol biopolymer transport system component
VAVDGVWNEGRRGVMQRLAFLAVAAALAIPTWAAAGSMVADPSGAGASSRAGSWIVFQTDVGSGNVIYLVRFDGTDAHALAPEVAGDQVHPDWSPDGEQIAFVVDGDLWTSGVDGGDAERLLDCPDGCDYPAWSPDGRLLAYSAYEAGPNAPGASTIRTIDLESKVVTDVVRARRPHLVDVPRWSPDGSHLVVGIDQMDADGNDTGAAIGTVTVGGGDISYLRDFDTFAYYPDWSWATDAVVFSTEALGSNAAGPGEGTWDLWTISPDGSDVRRVTDVPTGTRLWQPSWTPDGTSIIADREADRGGVLVDPSSGLLEELAYQDSPVTHPRLQPTR